MKTCSVCKESKNKSDYPWQNKSKGLVMAACKSCNRKRQRDKRKNDPDAQRKIDRDLYQKHKERRVEYARRYRKERPEKTRETNLKVKYGITLKQYDEMFSKQGGKCNICEAHQTDLSRVLCVDHCHDTGRVRGLLCDTCNKFLGFYEKLSVKCEVYLNDC